MAGNNPGPLAPHEFCYHVRKAPSYHNDFTDLARLILDATSVVTVKADNMEWYGELEQPKAGKDQHKTQESDFLKEYQKFQESVWGDVRTLDDETGLLFQVLQHWKEYRRKWGPGGVFTELEDFYPEHRAEIGRNFDMHQEIINAECSLDTMVEVGGRKRRSPSQTFCRD